MLKWVLLTPWVSPHQIPLAWQIATSLGEENFRYWYLEPPPENHKVWGWDKLITESWFHLGLVEDEALQAAGVVMSGVRSLDLFDVRLKEGKPTLYCSERWFKPPLGFLRTFVPSYLKMALRFVQCFRSDAFTYLPMGVHAARDMARLVGFLNGDVRCLFCAPKVAFESRPGGAIVPLEEAIKAGVLSKEEVAFGKRYGFVQISREHWGKVKPRKVYAKMRMWGYFVAPTTSSRQLRVASCELRVGADAQDCQCDLESTRICARAQRAGKYTEDTEKNLNHETHEKDVPTAQFEVFSSQFTVEDKVRVAPNGTENYREDVSDATIHNSSFVIRNSAKRTLRILWVGRMLDWKRVDTLVRACASEALKDKVELHLYGHGPEEAKLKTLAKGAPIHFHDFVPVEQVRDLMCAHDVYVLPSDGGEGWGAVVSEALEEGMQVFGTVEAGASGTVLPPTHLFKAGDVKRLTELLTAELPKVAIGEWTAEKGAAALLRE